MPTKFPFIKVTKTFILIVLELAENYNKMSEWYNYSSNWTWSTKNASVIITCCELNALLINCSKNEVAELSAYKTIESSIISARLF